MDDVDSWNVFLTDNDATKHIIIDNINDTILAENWVKKQLARYKKSGFGLMALEDKATGNFIGQCGLLEQIVDGVTEVEIGYHMLPKYWGHGYATEAATYFKNYAFENNIADSVISMILPDNVGSQMVASRNGMIKEKTIIWRGMKAYVYRVHK